MSKMDFKAYYEAIAVCSRKARKWMEEHPGVEAKVQFNYPDNTFLSAVPEDAVSKGYVTVNEAGALLMQAMGAFDNDPKAPSISMIRYALEYLEDIKKEDEKDGITG
jgi:hypothetical protein